MSKIYMKNTHFVIILHACNKHFFSKRNGNAVNKFGIKEKPH